MKTFAQERPGPRLAGPMLAALLLAGCQMTSFEKSPLAAAGGCDPALVGDWASIGDPPDEDGEVTLRLDAQCRLTYEERKATGLVTGEATTVHVARHGDHAYAWVDAAWALARFEEDHRPPAGDIMLVRYRLDGDVLELWSTDDKPIAHAIIDGQLEGEVIAADNELFNRLTGEQAPAVLERDGLFDAEPARFRRAAKD